MSLIYIVEDDKYIQEIETYALRDSGYDVKTFNCAKEFYNSLYKQIPDLVLLDIMLPDEDGFEILKKLRSFPETKKVSVMIISAKKTEEDKVKGFDYGADDYIMKPFGILEFIVRVKAVLRRNQNVYYEKIINLEEICLDCEKGIVYINDNLLRLTLTEYNLLKILMLNQKTVLSKAEIISKVWGENSCKPRTLDMHINTLRGKLGESGGRVKTIRHVGYILE